jgi:ATP-dependent DNA helicase RecQ
MPTGGGKLCYQPSFDSRRHSNCCFSIDCFDENQVDAIRSLSSERGIAHVLNSSHKTEIAQVKRHLFRLTKLLYVAPESLTKRKMSIFLKM